jgi:carboxymethylenebutenolidase
MKGAAMSYTSISLPSGESFKAYVAEPKTLPAPAVVVIQEIFGVNDGIRGKCDWLADQGFVAIAPDLFWRLEPGVELTDKTQEEWNRALDLMNRFDMGRGIEDVQATINHIRPNHDCTGEVGCMGYCLGGRIAYLTACRTDVDASVGYYGVGLDELLDEAETIKKPLMLHIAGEDKFVPKAAQEKIISGLKDHPQVTLHHYEGADHAFTRLGGEHYDAAAAKIADQRTIDFFHRHLCGHAAAKKVS